MAYELSELTKLSDMKNLESPLLSVTSKIEGEQTLTAIIQVCKEGYVPDGVQVRAEISNVLFTAEFSEALLADLEKDPLVKSVALARPQYLTSETPAEAASLKKADTEKGATEEFQAEKVPAKKTSAAKKTARENPITATEEACEPEASVLADPEASDQKSKKRQKPTKPKTT